MASDRYMLRFAFVGAFVDKPGFRVEKRAVERGRVVLDLWASRRAWWTAVRRT